MARRRATPARGSTCTGTGTHGTYISVREHGCTCPDAIDDRYRYEKLQRTGRLPAAHVDATGTVRKLQAMNALGYGGHYLAGRLDTAGSYVLNVMRGAKDKVHRLTAGRVDELYRELSGKPAEWNEDYCPHLTEGERGWRIEKTKAAAVERGFVSPFRWDGGDIDDPATQPTNRGPQQSCSTAEEDTASVLAVIDSCGGDVERIQRAYADIRGHNRSALVGALGDRGMTAAQIAELVGTSERQAERHLAAHHRGPVHEQPAAHVAAVAAAEPVDEDTDYVDDGAGNAAGEVRGPEHADAA